MAKKRAITINNFQKGIAPSCYFGFEEIRGLNISDKPGVVYPNYESAKDSGSTITTLMTSIINYGNNELASGGTKVYKRTGVSTWAELTDHTTSTIKNSSYWKGYAAMIYDETIEWYDVTDDDCKDTWSATAISEGGEKITVHAVDDDLYITADNVIDKIEEVSGENFDPTNNTTYTITKSVLDLPEGENIVDMVELGNNLMICGEYKIYPWNKSTTSSFNLPIIFNEKINRAIVFNQRMYVQAGLRGNWYVTNGTSVSLFAKLPETMIELGGDGQIHISEPVIRDELIMFGLYAASTDQVPQGIYSLNPKTGAVNVERLISTNKDGSTYEIAFGGFLNQGRTGEFLTAWEENSVYGVDRCDTQKYRNDEAFVISQFYTIGSNLRKKTFSEIQIELTKPLGAVFDAVKVEYRTAQNAGWTEIPSAEWETEGQQSLYAPFGMATNITNIQFKITLNNNAEMLSFTAV